MVPQGALKPGCQAELRRHHEKKCLLQGGPKLPRVWGPGRVLSNADYTDEDLRLGEMERAVGGGLLITFVLPECKF